MEVKAKQTAWTKLREWVRVVRAPKIRSMGDFAEGEIVISSGNKKGRFSRNTQPYSKAWFDLVDSGLWNRFFMTGCVQSGKTMHGFIIPIMYHLFEVQEPVICLVPDGEMVKAKWADLKAAIEKSRYADLLPKKGAGSKGGAVSKIYFTNGTFLQFMTGKGSDKSRAGATSRVVVITELDGMDEAGGGSREADPVTQCEARTKSYGSRKRIYGECTVSIEEGRTWQEWLKGTSTRLLVECCKCHAWVTPTRDELTGWQEAENEIEAEERAAFNCPACGVLWSEAERQSMIRELKPVHKSQEVIDGEVVGELPKTKTLSFRWDAFLNAFWSTSFIGTEEWIASKAEDSEAAEKERLQFAWATPYKPNVEASTKISELIILARAGSLPKRYVPAETVYLSAGMDLGKRVAHWVVIASDGHCSPHVVEYGTIKVHSDNTGEEYALMECMKAFKQKVDIGWEMPNGTKRIPDRVLIDSGYQGEGGGDVVYQFIRENGGGRIWSADGRGIAQKRGQSYTHPTQITARTPFIGEQYHISVTQRGDMLVAIHSNHWKTWVHKRLATPIGKPGAMTLYEGEGSIHSVYARHLSSEQEMVEFIPGRGHEIIWKKGNGENHYFDATYYACVGLHMAGARLIEEKPIVIETKPTQSETERPFVRRSARMSEDGGWTRRGPNASS